MEQFSYLIVVEILTKGYVMSIKPDKMRALRYYNKISKLYNSSREDLISKLNKMNHIGEYNIKGNVIYLPNIQRQGSDGVVTISLARIDSKIFCLQTFIRERENHSSLLPFSDEDYNVQKKLERISNLIPQCSFVAN